MVIIETPSDERQESPRGWFVDKLTNRMNRKFNCTVTVLGDVGIGKSSLALRLGWVTSVIWKVPFEVHSPPQPLDNVMFSTTNIFNLIRVLPKKSWIDADEAIIDLNSVSSEELIPFVNEHNTLETQPIAELYSRYKNRPTAIKVFSTDLINTHTARPSAIFKHSLGRQSLLRIRTRSGRTVTGTTSHSFIALTKDGVRIVKGSELKAGMKVPVSTNEPLMHRDTIQWAEIVEIKEIEPPEESVYDLSVPVPSYENFMNKEGIFVHNSRDWMQYRHKVMQLILGTYRWRQINLLLVAPNFAMVDVSARRLTNYIVKVRGRGLGFIYELRGSLLGRQWLKYLGMLYKVPMPPNHIWAPYEKNKQELHNTLMDNLQQEIDAREALGRIAVSMYDSKSVEDENNEFVSVFDDSKGIPIVKLDSKELLEFEDNRMNETSDVEHADSLVGEDDESS